MAFTPLNALNAFIVVARRLSYAAAARDLGVSTLWGGHHAALHAGLLTIQGQAPYEIKFRWVYGPPLPVGLTPAAREAMIAQRLQEILDRGMRPHRTRARRSRTAPDSVERPSWDVAPGGGGCP